MIENIEISYKSGKKRKTKNKIEKINNKLKIYIYIKNLFYNSLNELNKYYNLIYL